jgi:hypothetical protein
VLFDSFTDIMLCDHCVIFRTNDDMGNRVACIPHLAHASRKETQGPRGGLLICSNVKMSIDEQTIAARRADPALSYLCWRCTQEQRIHFPAHSPFIVCRRVPTAVSDDPVELPLP